MRKAAAVVVGVDKTGGLDPLKSAARGAREVAAWLKGDGFDVECLTDDSGAPVTANAVSTAITKFATKPATYDLLVVYFSGHGQWHTRADHWLLSGAPQNTAEAINLEGAMYTARKCGIPNVVFISDACRTIPRGDVDSLVNGVDAFPNHGIPYPTKVDYFKATSEARPAWEVAIGATSQSVLTRAILSTFENPEPQIVKPLGSGNDAIMVVPNRLLESVLQTRVDDILDGVDGSPTQNLETNVPSADTVYIARVRQQAAAGGAQPAPLPPPPVPRGGPTFGGGPKAAGPAHNAQRRPPRKIPGHAAADAISDTLSGARGRGTFDGVNRDAIVARTPEQTADQFGTQTGFIVRGAQIADAVIIPGPQTTFELHKTSIDSPVDAVAITTAVAAQPVVIVLQDGRSAVLPALNGYLGHVLFDETGLTNVSYVPSSKNYRWNEYVAHRAEIDRLRALVAVAIEKNTFRVRSEKEATQLAQQIRLEKALDPTLGLYAAYAFAQAGMDAQVRDVAGFMSGDLQAELFDVAMLSGNIEHPTAWTPRPVPFCPMLTQGWNLLRAYGVKLPDVLTTASRFLGDSLWSTFTERGTSMIVHAIKSGALK